MGNLSLANAFCSEEPASHVSVREATACNCFFTSTSSKRVSLREPSLEPGGVCPYIWETANGGIEVVVYRSQAVHRMLQFPPPQWNFGKYLVDNHGTPIAFFGSMIEPLSEDITDRIELLLNINN